MSKPETWHRVLDEAQERWDNSDLQGTGYREFIDRLDPIRRKAVLLGFLYYQVRRGGFFQWIINGYGIYLHEVIDILKEIGTYAATEAGAILELLAPRINTRPNGAVLMAITGIRERCPMRDGLGSMTDAFTRSMNSSGKKLKPGYKNVCNLPLRGLNQILDTPKVRGHSRWTGPN